MSGSQAYAQIASYLNRQGKDPRDPNNVRAVLAQLRTNPSLIPSLVVGPLTDTPIGLPSVRRTDAPTAAGATPTPAATPAATPRAPAPARAAPEPASAQERTSYTPPERARPSEIGMREDAQAEAKPPTAAPSPPRPASSPAVSQQSPDSAASAPDYASRGYSLRELGDTILGKGGVDALLGRLGVGAQASPQQNAQEIARNPLLQPSADGAAGAVEPGMVPTTTGSPGIARAMATANPGGGANPLLGPLPPTYTGSDATAEELAPPTPLAPPTGIRALMRPAARDALDTLTEGGVRGSPGSPVEEQPPPGTPAMLPPAVRALGNDVATKTEGLRTNIRDLADQAGGALTDPRSYEAIVRILAQMGIGTQQSLGQFGPGGAPGRTPRQPPANQ